MIVHGLTSKAFHCCVIVNSSCGVAALVSVFAAYTICWPCELDLWSFDCCVSSWRVVLSKFQIQHYYPK